MPTYCVVRGFNNVEWLVTTALDRQECIQQGGVIEERGSEGGSCGSSSAAMHSLDGLSESGIQGPTSALMILPLRLFRADFSSSPFVKRLEYINQMLGAEVEDIFAHRPALAHEIRTSLIMASFLAAHFTHASTESLSNTNYTAQMHDTFVKVAGQISRQTKNERLRSELNQIMEQARVFVGQTLQQIRTSMLVQQPSG